MSYSRERHPDPIPISDDGIGNRYAPRRDPRKREPTLQKLSGSAERRGSFEDIECGETIWLASCLEIKPQGAERMVWYILSWRRRSVMVDVRKRT